MSKSDSRAGRQSAWNTYWTRGFLHSCPTSFQGNYSGAIGEYWREAFRALPAEARIVDLASGNGALPRMLLEQRGVEVEVDAVDAAQLRPDWLASGSAGNVRFHPGVWMEDLPFAAASFDAVLSQFGIEYAERPAAWQEALRVLKPGGALYWVMHHRASVFAQVAAEESEAYEWLVQGNGLLEAARDLAPWLQQARQGRNPAGSSAAEEARRVFNAMQGQLEERISHGDAVDALAEARKAVHDVLARAASPVEAIDEYREHLREAALRTSELVQCALTPGEVDGMADWLRERRPAASVHVVELRQAEGLLAWALTLRDACQDA